MLMAYKRYARMDMELCNKYVLCIYENGGLTSAAKSLGISQPALSMALNSLEKKLGFHIFDRSSKPVSLTEEGKIYIEYLKEEQIRQNDCIRKIADLHKEYDGKLRIGGPMVYVNTIVAQTLSNFREKYPNCYVSIKDGNILDLIDEVNAGTMDFFISTSKDMPANFEVAVCGKEKIYLCIPRTWEINEQLKDYQVNPGDDGKCMDYSKLEGMKFISLSEKLPLQKEIRRFLKEYAVEMSSEICVNQVASGLKLASLGMGIVIATEQSLKAEAYFDKLCLYKMPDELFERDYYVVYDKNRYLSHICTEFIRMLGQ